ncbi:MAG: AtpZ/AtpI family protein [bacterium]|nr:AtpZ/AtpI family protein [bacterium]
MDSQPDNLENNKKANGLEAAWWQPAIIMFLRLSVWIAAPIIIALYLGKWLDKKFDMAPWLFLSCIGLAFIISIFGLVKNTTEELKKLEKSEKNK